MKKLSSKERSKRNELKIAKMLAKKVTTRKQIATRPVNRAWTPSKIPYSRYSPIITLTALGHSALERMLPQPDIIVYRDGPMGLRDRDVYPTFADVKSRRPWGR